jgi:uncharacterized protein (DUF983 family)
MTLKLKYPPGSLEVMAAAPDLLAALVEWKCPACGGTRFYSGYSADAPEGQPCRKCRDTEGLHPTAWAAVKGLVEVEP